jgi:hypothetical protein
MSSVGLAYEILDFPVLGHSGGNGQLTGRISGHYRPWRGSQRNAHPVFGLLRRQEKSFPTFSGVPRCIRYILAES